jgi:hypothetical protein
MPTEAPLTLSVNQAICMIEPRDAAMMIASTSSGEPLTSYRSPVMRAISVLSNGSGDRLRGARRDRRLWTDRDLASQQPIGHRPGGVQQ